MLKLIIGNKVYSSWSLRGWLAVKQSGLPFEEVVVPLYDDAWEARKLEGDLAPSNGKVATLWDGDTPVWDSLAILDYLDAKTGRTKFWPSDPAALALARSMAAEMHAGYMPLRREHSMNLRLALPSSTPGDEVQADIDRIMTLWAQARTRFGADGDYLFGGFGAVDIMFAPVVTRFQSYGLPVTALGRTYMDAVFAHPFMAEWVAGANAEDWVIPRFEPQPAE
ncbi:MAG: glutathione S-transferase family protein [Sphingobium sp.]|nr:glutathione S-transferase family protein [Sphingobium sp.]